MSDARAEEDRRIREEIKAVIKNEDVFDHYEKVPGGNLGEGSFGQVWKGESYENGKVYAIKTIRNASEKALGREIKATPRLWLFVSSHIVDALPCCCAIVCR